LALLSCLVGFSTGFVVALFGLALRHAERLREAFILRAHGWAALGFLLTVGIVAAAAALAAWLVQRFAPAAAGSGIPHVEAVVNGELPPAPLSLSPVKFVGGWLAIGGGLALGREGPSVQMGANAGFFLGKMFRLADPDCMALLVAGAGAGLASAFNAPIAGAVFVMEELTRRFDTRMVIAALGASCSAIGVAQLVLGRAPEFKVEPMQYSGIESGFLFLALGIAAGFLGMAYNGALLRALSLAGRLHWPVELRAAAIGGSVGALAWFAPGLVGGGDAITQRTLSGGESLAVLSLAFAIRFLLGPVSYAAGTPGGLFAPMLVLGSQIGVLFAGIAGLALPHLGAPPAAFAVVGMAAFFTAVVRAPVTGTVLIVELTASFTQLLPMLWACFAAMLIPTIFGVSPIYDALQHPARRRQRGSKDPSV
jgi:CIC family chloride channel protein